MMKKWNVWAVLAVSTISAHAMAQTVEKVTPSDVESTTPVGGVIWQRLTFNGVPGVVLGGLVQANWGTAEIVDLPTGANLMIIRERRLKACAERTIIRFGGSSMGGWEDCLIDTDDDGRFDRVSFNQVAGARDIVPPVPYERAVVPVIGAAAEQFARTITFLGRSANDLRFSYREFSNGIARPAFTEDLTIPVPETFPQTILVKEVRLTLLGLDSGGLSYRLN